MKHSYLVVLAWVFILQTGSAQTSNQEPKNIQTVVADGFGVDFQTAQQSAAQNALTNVVGSFIDANSSIEQRTEISAGIRDTVEKHTVDIKESTKEYSQGTIQKIEILEVGTEGGLTKVKAKVSVRIDDFRAYIKKIAQGEIAVDQGLFAQAAVARKQGDNRTQLLMDNVLKPLTDGNVVDFQVIQLEPFSNTNYKGGNRQIDNILRFNRPESIFILSIRASLKPEFVQNMIQTLESISKNRLSAPFGINVGMGSKACEDNLKVGNPQLDFSFFTTDNIYIDEKTKQVTAKSRNMVGYLIEGERGNVNKYLQSTSLPKLSVTVLDGAARVLQEDIAYASPVYAREGTYAGNALGHFSQYRQGNRADLIFPQSTYGDGMLLPYLFVSTSKGGCMWQTTEREFKIALIVEADVLKNAKKVVVKMAR